MHLEDGGVRDALACLQPAEPQHVVQTAHRLLRAAVLWLCFSAVAIGSRVCWLGQPIAVCVAVCPAVRSAAAAAAFRERLVVDRRLLACSAVADLCGLSDALYGIQLLLAAACKCAPVSRQCRRCTCSANRGRLSVVLRGS